MPKTLRTTAAWRIAFWTTLAFSLGTFAAFFIFYVFVAQEIRARSDAWLTGEAQVLAQVAEDTPRDSLYDHVVEEVAELAMHEVPDETSSGGERMNAVFFLSVNPAADSDTLFVGPGPKDKFWSAIRQARWVAGVPQSIKVAGWRQTAASFRVVAPAHQGPTAIYLGLSERGDKHILHKLTRRFLSVWAGTVLFGLLISYLSARRTLQRVERITETVARIGSEELDERLPEPANSDEVSRLARTFNHMLGRIQASVNQLRTVTDSVAHDLKSPVTSIRGTLEGALSAANGEHWRDAVGQAIEGLDRVSALLNTTLDVAEAQAGALHLDRAPVDLGEVVTQLVSLYQPAMAERHHEVRTHLGSHVVVEADLALLNRTLSNLLENELLHLPEGCQIDIRLRSHEGDAELVVEDNGPGFPPEIANRALERFVKGERSPGNGLGLAFVDAVVQAHRGTVKISSRPLGGATVTLLLPISALQPA
ncbi:MAG TPA: ATP-binding protein [Terriglobia bacterium]|nr:ATP-binding protein [Terriglobia bacterium]